MYPQYFQPGHGELRELKSGYGQMAFVDVTLPLYLCRHGISGWLESSLVLTGAKNTRVEHETCVHNGAPACVWDLYWQ